MISAVRTPPGRGYAEAAGEGRGLAREETPLCGGNCLLASSRPRHSSRGEIAVAAEPRGRSRDARQAVRGWSLCCRGWNLVGRGRGEAGDGPGGPD